MTPKAQDLRTRLIDAAEAEIAEKGLRGLKARDVTARAGCSLGSLYTAVDDLDMLIIHVNSRTIARLGAALSQAAPTGATPVEAMQALAQTYVAFALRETRLWSAIFNHRLPEGREVPDWHKAEYPQLIQQIIGPLSHLRPDLPQDTLRLRAQTLFASVHGVVQLAIHGRFVGVPRDHLAAETRALVDAMTRGIHLVQPEA